MTKRAGGLSADEFVEKWKRATLSERAASHEHFIDLCHLLDQPTPAEADATGADYCFEKHVKVVGAASKGSKGDAGFVDVWRRGYFAWEYKRKDKHNSPINWTSSRSPRSSRRPEQLASTTRLEPRADFSNQGPVR